MAETSSAPSEIPFADSKTPITDQLNVVWTKARRLETEETILGNHVFAQIKYLIKISESGKGKLSGAEKTEINLSTELEVWLEEVYAAISLADDLLDECEYQKHHQSLALRDTNKTSRFKVRNFFDFPSSRLDLWRSNMNRRFGFVNATLDAILRKEVPEGAVGERSARMQAMVDASEIESKAAVEGNDVSNIVENLLYFDNVDYLSFISLVGWGHSGKTVLAKKVYKSAEVMFHFDERMWVHAPQGDFDIYPIAKGMLTTLTRDRVDGVPTVEEISDSLRKRLKGRRYLLVLASMSQVNSKTLDPLIAFLQDLGGSRGCKILTTTGKTESAAESSFVYFTHMMPVLPDYSSILFSKISLAGQESVIPSSFPGDAWSVKVLAGLKCRIQEERRWLEIMKGTESWMDAPRDNAKLCFNYMSSLPLKKCLQYCSIFPKGHLIQKEEIIHLWMAQGYLNLPTSTILVPEREALGLEYYEILLKCCFLQVSEDDDFDGESCKMPHLLHDVVVSEDSKDCCRTLKNEVISPKSVQFCMESLHLSLINCEVVYGRFSKSARESFSKLRTLRLENTSGFLTDFLEYAGECLRVLIVVQDSMEDLPSSIGRLRCLKYLDISRTSVVRLPDSISELYNLQTLKLYGLAESLKNFENLVSLRHLYIQKDVATLSVFPEKFQELVKLWHSKASFKVFLDKNGVIDSSEQLKVPNTCSSISIHGLENATRTSVIDQIAGIVKKYGLESLKLHWSARRANTYYDEDAILENLEPDQSVKNLAIENFKGTTFPSWMLEISSGLLPHLVKLDLKNCSWCEVLPPLGRLPCLTILKIVGMDNISCISRNFYGLEIKNGILVPDDVFPSLKVFILSRMPKLAEWRGLDLKRLAEWHGLAPPLMQVFPSLVRLEVEQCPMLATIPDIVLCWDSMRLRKLRVAHCERLIAIPARLKELKLLAELELFGLPHLSHFSIEGARNLKRLILGCFSADMELVPSDYLSTVTNLTIWGYDEKELPYWVTDLPSLQILKLELCASLEQFPSVDSMKKLTNLKELNISNCPLLEDGCITGGRPEWKKVYHIPTIVVNETVVASPETNKVSRIETVDLWAFRNDKNQKAIDDRIAEGAVSNKSFVTGNTKTGQADGLKEGTACFLQVIDPKSGKMVRVSSANIICRPKSVVDDPLAHCVQICKPILLPNAPLPYYSTRFKCVKDAEGLPLNWPVDMIQLLELSGNEPSTDTVTQIVRDETFLYHIEDREARQSLKAFIKECIIEGLQSRVFEVEMPNDVMGSDLECDVFYLKLLIDVELFDIWLAKIDDKNPKSWIQGDHLDLWAHYLYEKMPAEKRGRVQFVPASLSFNRYTDPKKGQTKVHDGILKVMNDNSSAEIFILPFCRREHWVLVLIIPKLTTIYCVDSLGHGISNQSDKWLHDLMHKIGASYDSRAPSWRIVNIEHKFQRNSWECGYYVMLYMEKVALSSFEISDLQEYFPTDGRSYDIDLVERVIDSFCRHLMEKVVPLAQQQKTQTEED